MMSANRNKGKGSELVELDDRKWKIFTAIIKNYLETGEPVGSRTISKYTDLNLSSATIRNEMADLEEMGLIIQPHDRFRNSSHADEEICKLSTKKKDERVSWVCWIFQSKSLWKIPFNTSQCVWK